MTTTDVIASKTTTQHAPLESFLTRLRTSKVTKFVREGDVVLDLQTLRAITEKVAFRLGIDSCFKKNSGQMTDDGIFVFGSFVDLRKFLQDRGLEISIVTSLACFEHLYTDELREVLHELKSVCRSDATIVGTVPRPPARPVLEFLSYRLGLIDPSQIADHKVYYDRGMLEFALNDSGWHMTAYRPFQIGFNSLFVMQVDSPQLA